MKALREIKNRIKELNEEIDEMHNERNYKKEKYGGVSDDENDSFFSDLHYKSAEIKTLEWVLNP